MLLDQSDVRHGYSATKVSLLTLLALVPSILHHHLVNLGILVGHLPLPSTPLPRLGLSGVSTQMNYRISLKLAKSGFLGLALICLKLHVAELIDLLEE